jgi:23S rRNA (adenine2030-N6)-methyltransferase
LVKAFDRRNRTAAEAVDLSKPRFYPGSPWLAQALARPQDRLALCEKHPEEFAALRAELDFEARATLQSMDGYAAVKAVLPPPEKRAFVLIDPPFEDPREYAHVVGALREGLRRLSGGTFAVWYPLTERARVDAFFAELVALRPPPTWSAELTVVGPTSPVKMKGCGLVVINPPWQIDRELSPLLPWLASVLAQSPGGTADLRWLVPE